MSATYLGLVARVAVPGLESGSGCLTALVLEKFPAGVKGLVIVAILAAIMSTGDVCVLTAPDSLREEFLAEVAPMCQIIDRGNMLELPVRGYSKASGCLAVAQALGEDLADCYAIGDSANDLEMLQCVGHPLVMGNAPARVQAVAEYVTGTPAEDGLYHAMVHAGLLAE